LTLADHVQTMGLLPAYADTPNCKWFCHKTYYYQVMVRVEAAAGANTISELQRGARQPLFLGYPVEFAQALPRTEANSQVSALFGDLALASTMGDRRRTTLFSDPYSRSANDQLQIRGTERIDIVVHDVGNAHATAASRVAGPIVGLITAAS
jgi:HK97 family phage major capsid protein